MDEPRPLDPVGFRVPNRAFGILPFWFLNGELDPGEMRFQLQELRAKEMQGVILHGRYGLEMPYLGEKYLDRIRLGVVEANRLGLAAWVYDEMNWPSGTADKRVLRDRPDLAQRYLECVSFTITGPWFMCLTGEDSRYLDFQRSLPVAMFAIGEDGRIVDLTANLSFKKVVPWEVPPGRWRLCYIVEKRADYYIDALDPEATSTFLRLGYEPYLDALKNGDTEAHSIVGFYSDEPAMHYFLTAGNNPIVPWTKNMFRRFRERNGYDLRTRLVDLFFDLRPEGAHTRYDFYRTTTEFYSEAYYRQIHEWCDRHGVLFTAHLLYEEWIRQMVRVEGNPFRHYENMDIVAVDHLYPVIGTRDTPDQHVAMKLASSAAHHFGSERVICESFGGIFMDATMQRMKWIADWQYVLGINVLNPHGFHYTLEGARKRDWPPSMFYQYPWWRYYGEFSAYMSRTSEMLTSGRHVAKVAMLWPINAMFASYLPHERTENAASVEAGLNVLTDVLLRRHHDFDYLDEDVLERADTNGGLLRVADEEYELLLIPPMPHIRAATLDVLERFVEQGGRVMGTLVPPRWAMDADGMQDASERVASLFGDVANGGKDELSVLRRSPGPGATAFVAGDPNILMEGPGAGRDQLEKVVDEAVRFLIVPDLELSNPDVFVLHRRRDESDVYFIVNTTFEPQSARMEVVGGAQPVIWDPTSGLTHAATLSRADGGAHVIDLTLPPVGSLFVVVAVMEPSGPDAVEPPNGTGDEALPSRIELTGPWTFAPEDDNALVLKSWRAAQERPGTSPEEYVGLDVDDGSWEPMVAGAWAYQLPVEPEDPWPIPVWYRISFAIEQVPERLVLLVDGFDGDGHEVWLNGQRLARQSVRSRLDAQMKELDLSGSLRRGRNVLSVRLLLREATDGLVDHVKLLGSFALGPDEDGGYRLVAAERAARPSTWTEQGFPFFSGRGSYRSTIELERIGDARALLHVPVVDDVVDVEVNGRSAGIRLWDPYVVDVTTCLRPGSNEVTVRVANTLANLLNGVERPSGLAGPPVLEIEPSHSTPASASAGEAVAAQ